MMLKSALAAVLLSACMLPPAGQSTGPSSPPPSSSGMGDPSYVSSSPSPASSSGPSSAAAPARAAGPQTVSVTIRSACRKTAKVFYGEKPGFSSGTQSSISSNSVQSKTFKVGDQMWVLDDGGRALGNVRISESTRQLEIDASCSSIRS